MDINNGESQPTDPIKQTQYSDPHHQAILTAIDTQLDKDKNDFVKRMNNQAEKQEEIERLAQELKGDIKNLANIVKRILAKHHTDYIMTFSAFMETVRKDLRAQIEQMELIKEEKKKVNDSNVIRCERDFFRSYSIKLSSVNKELTNKIDDMTIRMKILSDEVNGLTIKWQSLEKDNKRLALELECNILKNKELRKDNLRYYKMTSFTPSNLQSNPLMQVNSETKVEAYQHLQKSGDIIEKLQDELKREKYRNHRSSSELSNLFSEKNRLENIFLDCVEETRKNVWNRRMRGTMTSKISTNCQSFPLNSNGKFETFQPTDKREILENFLFNNEVCTLLRDALFQKTTISQSMKHLHQQPPQQSQQQKPARLYFEKINLKKYPTKEDKTLEEKLTFFNPKKSTLLNAKKAFFDFKKKAQSQNMLLPIQMNS